MSTPGERIRQRRDELGLSQEKLAELAEVHSITISRWENGRQALEGENLSKLARAIGRPEAWILYGSAQLELGPVLDEQRDRALALAESLEATAADLTRQASELRAAAERAGEPFDIEAFAAEQEAARNAKAAPQPAIEPAAAEPDVGLAIEGVQTADRLRESQEEGRRKSAPKARSRRRKQG